MKNLVLGSEGFVGKYLCKYLEKKGEQVVRFDIKRSKKEDCRFAKLTLKGIDKVFFLAWDVGGAKYLYREDTQLKQLQWNIDILKNVMPQLKVPFVFTSSQLAEENTVYGITKKLGEFWTKLMGGCFVRLTNVYGVDEKTSERSHVISDFVNQAKKGKIKMMTDGSEKRQFIHLEDICNTLYETKNSWVSIKDIAQIIQTITLKDGLKKMICKT
jgi:nucleoside-diphosphate-sugar epimerase